VFARDPPPRGVSDQAKRAGAGTHRSPTPGGLGDPAGTDPGGAEGPRNQWKASGEPFGRRPSAPPR
jgi:hypothetical protein